MTIPIRGDLIEISKVYAQKRRRAMFALAAITLFASPFSAQATSITSKEAKYKDTISLKNKVYNIEV